MKKLIFTFAGLMIVCIINAQPLEEILKNYSAANKLDLLTDLKTIKINHKLSVMGMEGQTEMWLKNPNKIKIVTNMNGQESIQVFDGEKGYMIFDMGGTKNSTEMTPDLVKDMLRSNMFENYWMNFYKDGLLTLEGEEIVNEKPAFKLKATFNEGYSNVFIDKTSYLIVKQSINTGEGGRVSESYPSDYALFNGVFLPGKIKGSFFGAEAIITVTRVEVDIPMDDNIFKPN